MGPQTLGNLNESPNRVFFARRPSKVLPEHILVFSTLKVQNGSNANINLRYDLLGDGTRLLTDTGLGYLRTASWSNWRAASQETPSSDSQVREVGPALEDR